MIGVGTGRVYIADVPRPVHGDDRAHDNEDRAYKTCNDHDNHGDTAAIYATSGGTDVSDTRSIAPSLPLMQLMQEDPFRRVRRAAVPRRGLTSPGGLAKSTNTACQTNCAGRRRRSGAARRARLRCLAWHAPRHGRLVRGRMARGENVPAWCRAQYETCARTHCCSAADGAANDAADAATGAAGAEAMAVVLVHSSRSPKHALQVALDESSAHVE
jgi:hypothetical protein